MKCVKLEHSHKLISFNVFQIRLCNITRSVAVNALELCIVIQPVLPFQDHLEVFISHTKFSNNFFFYWIFVLLMSNSLLKDVKMLVTGLLILIWCIKSIVIVLVSMNPLFRADGLFQQMLCNLHCADNVTYHFVPVSLKTSSVSEQVLKRIYSKAIEVSCLRITKYISLCWIGYTVYMQVYFWKHFCYE